MLSFHRGIFFSRGKLSLRIFIYVNINSAPRLNLAKATPTGVKNSKQISIKKNVDPQAIDRKIKLGSHDLFFLSVMMSE